MASDFVPEPKVVPYGCQPWSPDRELIEVVRTDGGFKGRPRARKCHWCKGQPKPDGEMCPACQGMSVPAETKLARQRIRAATAQARNRAAKFRPKLPSAKQRREKAA